jgi:hypothetical protein
VWVSDLVAVAASAATAAATVATATTAATAAAFATAATAAATAAAAATTTAEATAGALFARAGFVDDEGTALEFSVLEAFDGGPARFIFHFDEAEPAGALRLTVHGEVNSVHFAVLSEQVRDIVFGTAEGDVPHVNIDHLDP